MQLKRSMNMWALLFSAVGGIIGSGWLLGPFFVAQYAGPASVLSWMLGGVLMMLIAFTFAELATSLPITGGSVLFLHISHGPLLSFSTSWLGWLASVAVPPVETIALLHYAATYLPFLMHTTNGAHLLTGYGFIGAAVLLFFLCWLNAAGLKVLSGANSVVVVLKLAVPIVTIVILSAHAWNSAQFFEHGFAPMGLAGVLASLSSGGVIFSLIGYSPAIQLAGETKNPQKSIPIAIIGSLLICSLLYMAIQATFVACVPASALAHGWDHVHFMGDSGPFAAIVMGLGLFVFAKILFVDAAVSPYGTALIYTANSARMAYALGKSGFLSKKWLTLNRNGMPISMIVLNFVLGLFLLLPFPTWQNMMSFLVSSFVFSYAVGPLSLLALRTSLPNLPRPFRIPCPYVFCLLAFYICNLIIYWTGWQIVSKMLLAVLIGYAILWMRHTTRSGRAWRRIWWMALYVCCIGVWSVLGRFGGGLDWMPFGWDFLIIAASSWVVFEAARRSALSAQEVRTVMNSLGFQDAAAHTTHTARDS